MARRRSAGHWLLAAGLCLAVVGCGAPGAPEGSDTPASPSSGDSGGTADGGDADGGGPGTEGPITIAFEGRSFGYPIGRCDITDGVVYARARAGSRSFEVTLPEWDRDVAYSRREGSISAVVAGDGSFWELTGSRDDAGTTWDWTVSGTQVEVRAVMGNRTTATLDSGVETFTETPDVTISMDCQGTFGTGFPEGEPMHEEFSLLGPPRNDRIPGSVTVDLEGSTYNITYLTTCQFFSNDVSAEGVANEASIYFYSEGQGVNLILNIGDLRAEKSLERWMLPPNASHQSDFAFTGSGTTRTWTGNVVSERGGQAEATISVECSEGDAFDTAGTASIIIDGVTHVLDEVTQCTIDGATIEFFGRQSIGDVALVVTSGGSDILFGDESGQTVTSGVVFTINGQRATWAGVLAGNRQATVAIDCG